MTSPSPDFYCEACDVFDFEPHEHSEVEEKYIKANPWYAPIASAIRAEKQAGQPMFLGFPDRWFEKARYRCKNDHVSRTILKSEMRGDLCLECHSHVRLTFPEDVDGPCVYPGVPGASPEPQRTSR